MMDAVWCVMPSNRPQFAERAVQWFKAQQADGAGWMVLMEGDSVNGWTSPGVVHVRAVPNQTIGALRNNANQVAVAYGAQIIVHVDDDDWSAPDRVAVQTEQLRQSGADVVGYREMLFWDERISEAWIYRSSNPNYILGTSLCYWAGAWTLQKFADAPHDGDVSYYWAWLQNQKVLGLEMGDEPKMIARLHEGNTRMKFSAAERGVADPTEWTRAPQWDEFCRERMA